LTPYYSANRSVREYTDRYYVPAAAAYHERAANSGAMGEQMLARRRMLDQQWAAIRFGELTVDTTEGMHLINVEVYSDDLTLNVVRVELYADGVKGNAPMRHEMMRGRALAGAPGAWLYTARVRADRPPTDYTARAIPQCPGAAIPLEESRILWQR
jgi:starch phosphorylase